MRKRNSWIQKKSVVVIIAVLLLIAILAVAAELGMKSGSRPLGMIEKIKNGNKDNNESIRILIWIQTTWKEKMGRGNPRMIQTVN